MYNDFEIYYKTAVEQFKSEDYGSARREALKAWAAAVVGRDRSGANLSMKLVMQIDEIIIDEFREEAARLELTLTPENVYPILREHSPHMLRYSKLMDLLR